MPRNFAALAVALLSVNACSGGGGGGGRSPTEPPPVPPEPYVLQVTWEYDIGDGIVTGTSSLVAGETLVLYNVTGEGHCVGEGANEICYPDVAECRSTTWGLIQAYYHDSLSANLPGTLGPSITSGCSTAGEYGYYTRCCIAFS